MINIDIKGMGFIGEKILINYKLKSGWYKIIKGSLSLHYFNGPGKLLVKHTWRHKPFIAIENTSKGTLYFKEPFLVLKENMCFKRK